MDILVDGAVIPLPTTVSTRVLSLTTLADSERRLDYTLQNTGGQNVTACSYKTGARAAVTRNGTREAAIIAALTAGGSWSETLQGADVPEALEIDLTVANSAGSTAVVDATGTNMVSA